MMKSTLFTQKRNLRLKLKKKKRCYLQWLMAAKESEKVAEEMSPIALQRHSLLLDDMLAYEKDFVRDMETSWSLYFEPLCRPDESGDGKGGKRFIVPSSIPMVEQLPAYFEDT